MFVLNLINNNSGQKQLYLAFIYLRPDGCFIQGITTHEELLNIANIEDMTNQKLKYMKNKNWNVVFIDQNNIKINICTSSCGVFRI